MSTPDADDLLRRAVVELAARDDCSWAGIYFVEENRLVLGPEAGTPDPQRRATVPVLWRETRVAELAADGDVDPSHLETVAASIADLCLVGWDTGGEVWQS
jgi:putative methionine-R-sulfoxide reductase with GAF domain